MPTIVAVINAPPLQQRLTKAQAKSLSSLKSNSSQCPAVHPSHNGSSHCLIIMKLPKAATLICPDASLSVNGGARCWRLLLLARSLCPLSVLILFMFLLSGQPELTLEPTTIVELVSLQLMLA